MEGELYYPLTVTVKDLVTHEIYDQYHVNKGYSIHEVFFRFQQVKELHPNAFMGIKEGMKQISANCNKR